MRLFSFLKFELARLDENKIYEVCFVIPLCNFVYVMLFWLKQLFLHSLLDAIRKIILNFFL